MKYKYTVWKFYIFHFLILTIYIVLCINGVYIRFYPYVYAFLSLFMLLAEGFILDFIGDDYFKKNYSDIYEEYKSLKSFKTVKPNPIVCYIFINRKMYDDENLRRAAADGGMFLLYVGISIVLPVLLTIINLFVGVYMGVYQ